ncbi:MULTISPECIES: alpha/beta fold hydrolase [Roseomonadaceae]|uniref:Alpha/beta fold hydrolase n=1 Tax=Falsiroseomonas oleicola TaxID=2801474 RepID=A0ABS6H828_9PROT|nr:alpha/beta fold hydrolase [Roseomonas oleicola]MBU8544849.1 alpha/beta fold hydrolase [Roseomonas oleicola]
MEREEAATLLDRLDREAARWSTPCGEGVMIWRGWGEGPPLLLLHGWGGSWMHWARNIPVLARRHRLLVPDLPGMGDSDLAPPGTLHAGLAAMLGQGLRRILGADARYAVVGFSFGGALAVLLAAAEREAVHRLVLAAPGGLGAFTPRPTRRLRGLPPEARAEALRANILSLMLADPDSVDGLAMEIEDRNASRLRATPLPREGLDLGAALPRLAVAPLVVWGSRDNFCADMLPERMTRLHALRPDARIHLLDGAGHWVAHEAAADFDALLLSLPQIA